MTTIDHDLAYLAGSARIIERGMADAAALLDESSQCVLAASKHAARRSALQHALAARDRLDTLIARLGGDPRDIGACVADLMTNDIDKLRELHDQLSDARADVERRIEEIEGGDWTTYRDCVTGERRFG
jgi:hypothetical protein